MKKLFYYILTDPDKTHVTKIGITTNPDNRLRAYRTAAPNCFFSGLYVLPNKLHEKRILDIMRDRFTVTSEVVRCNPQLVKNIVEGYFVDNDIDY
jgi:hypothetical protein